MSDTPPSGGFLAGPDYLKLPRDPQPWVIRHLVPIGGLTNLYGPPKGGKTYLALQMALAITNRQKWFLGFEVAKHGPVAYLQIDTPRGEWAARLSKLARQGHSLDNLYFSDMNMAPFPYNVLDPLHHQWLKHHLAAVRPVLVIVDTLRESFNGNENDSDIMKQVIGNIVAAARPAAVMFLSHSRKDGLLAKTGEDDLMGDNRGSGYVAGRMDTVVKFTGKSMSLQGRSIGKTQLLVKQNKEQGLFELGSMGEAAADSEFIISEAVRSMAEANPSRSQREIARELMAMFTLTEATARRRVAQTFEHSGIEELQSPEPGIAEPTGEPA